MTPGLSSVRTARTVQIYTERRQLELRPNRTTVIVAQIGAGLLLLLLIILIGGMLDCLPSEC